MKYIIAAFLICIFIVTMFAWLRVSVIFYRLLAAYENRKYQGHIFEVSTFAANWHKRLEFIDNFPVSVFGWGIIANAANLNAKATELLHQKIWWEKVFWFGFTFLMGSAFIGMVASELDIFQYLGISQN